MNEENMVNEVVEEPEVNGMNTGLAMLIGGVITVAGIAAGKMLKKAWTNRKIKKETLDASDFEVDENRSDVYTE